MINTDLSASGRRWLRTKKDGRTCPSFLIYQGTDLHHPHKAAKQGSALTLRQQHPSLHDRHNDRTLRRHDGDASAHHNWRIQHRKMQPECRGRDVSPAWSGRFCASVQPWLLPILYRRGAKPTGQSDHPSPATVFSHFQAIAGGAEVSAHHTDFDLRRKGQYCGPFDPIAAPFTVALSLGAASPLPPRLSGPARPQKGSPAQARSR